MNLSSVGRPFRLTRSDSFFIGTFDAMASPCEVLLETDDESIAVSQMALATTEAQRIEAKYSRYRPDSVLNALNAGAGECMEVDEETARLFDYANGAYCLSEGLFDITSGVLRRVWQFNRSEMLVDEERLAEVRACIGWGRVLWKRPTFRMPIGFEIDLGGIGKEYAADRILSILFAKRQMNMLVNLGGDLAAVGDRLWSVGVEDAASEGGLRRVIHLRSGGIATSGTTHRYAKLGARRVGHILHPKTGRPIEQAPASVTVAATTCTEAGLWSTLAILQGAHAEQFLQAQALEFFCDRT